MIGDLLGERGSWKGGRPRWHARGRVVQWGPKVVERHGSRREARRAARGYRRTDARRVSS